MKPETATFEHPKPDDVFAADTAFSERVEHDAETVRWKLAAIAESVLAMVSQDAEDVRDVRKKRFVTLDRLVAANAGLSYGSDFVRLKDEIEEYFSSRNPHLLSLVRRPWYFRAKLWSLNALIEQYSFETAEHTEEVWIVSTVLANMVNDSPVEHPKIGTSNFIDFGKFHDLGKLLVPSEILWKRGALTDWELSEMRKHATFSSVLVKMILFYSTDRDNPETRVFANEIVETALYHHKLAWGGGYPVEVPSENVTVEAEIVRLSDIFQALSSRRCYKEPFPIERVEDIISNTRNSFHYAFVYDTFWENREKFFRIVEDRTSNVEFPIGNLWTIEFDSGHSDLFVWISDVVSATDHETFRKSLDLLERTVAHFAEEEILMSKTASYAGKFREHEKAHDDMVRRLKAAAEVGNPSPEHLRKFIDAWFRKALYEHGKSMDSEMMGCVRSDIVGGHA